MLLYNNTIRNTSFCDEVTNIYYEILLKIFINTIAQPHVKRLTHTSGGGTTFKLV